MNEFLRRTWCEIDLDQIRHNANLVQSVAEKEIMAVVKADAYGHGDWHVAKTLAGCGIRWFAVSNSAEALSLRRAGLTQDILVLGYTPPEQALLLCENAITQTIYDLGYAESLHQALEATAQFLPVHVKVDTGMGRIGLAPEVSEVSQLYKYPRFRLQGIYTHFSHADSHHPDAVAYTDRQAALFSGLLDELAARGLRFSMVHAQNSGGILAHQYPFCNCARAGIVLYGLAPAPEMLKNVSLKPVMQMKTVVTMVKEVPEGTSISYGRTYTTTRPTVLATIAVGYADGYPRLLSSIGQVLIHGKRCPIVGRVCMDQTVVDVSHLDAVSIGDIVTLFGKEGDSTLPVEEIAELAGTINYEIVCGMSRRVPRVYLENSKAVCVEDYLLR